MQKPTVLFSGTAPSARAWTKAAAAPHSLFTWARSSQQSVLKGMALQCPEGVSMGRKGKKREPTPSPVPASAIQLTQETEGEMLTQFTGIILQNLSQCASRRQVPHCMCCMGRLSQAEGTAKGEQRISASLSSPLTRTHPHLFCRMWPCSGKQCFGKSKSSAACTGRCGNI